MTQKELTAVVLDVRLTPESVRVILDVARRGSGEYEVPFTHFASLLRAGEKTTRSAIKLACDRRWIARRPGGRGKHDLYAFTPANSATLIAEENGLSPAESATLSENEDTVTDTYPGKNSHPKSLSPAENATLSAPRACEQAGSDKTSETRQEPPVVPLDAEAEAALEKHAGLFNGCRGSIRDYLQARVPERRRPSWIHTIACYMNDQQLVFRQPDGNPVPGARRPHLLSTALNELLQHGEQRDVEAPMKPMKWPDGDARNTRTKLGILISQEWEHGRSNGSTDPDRGGAPRKGAAEAGGGGGDYDDFG